VEVHVRGLVKATNDAFADAIARGDAAAAAAVYAEDARLLPPGAEPLTGRIAAERFWREGIEAGVCGLELETLELEKRGDTAVEVGRYVLASAVPDAAATIDHGKYVVIHKRQADGSWKRGVDIFNSDAPTDRSEARPVDVAGPPRSGRDT
jgi:ketosteroid isomerase-like protein